MGPFEPLDEADVPAQLRAAATTGLLAPLFSASEDALVVIFRGACVDANPAFVQLLGAPDPAHLRGEAIERWFYVEDRPALLSLLSGSPLPTPRPSLRVLRADGEVRAAEVAGVAPLGAEAQGLVLRDVTERRRQHAAMLLQDRMVSIGTLAAGVAHEINNPLSYIIGNLAFLEEEVATLPAGIPGEARQSIVQAVHEARQGAERVREIVRNLQTFSRADHQVSRSTDVRRTVELALNMAWIEIRHRARLIKDFQSVPAVEASEARLGQIFLSLLLNAAHALPEGSAEQHQIRVATRADGDRVLVEIANTGPGLAPEIARRIFDPFATFGAPGVGSGLGLSIAHSLIADLGGDIMLETSAATGTAFRVILPAASSRHVANAPKQSRLDSLRPGARGLRLLVVDDEPLLGSALKRSLAAHEVTFVSSGRLAIERLGEDAGFDLIVSDLMMPDLTGMDLFRWLEAARPGLEQRVVFVTGGTFTPEAEAFLARVPNARFQKPLDMEELRAFIASWPRATP